MKYLSDYVQTEQTNVFNKYGAFFAFSNEQFDEAKKEGVKYISLGHGLIAPKEHAAKIWPELDAVHEEGRKADVAENGLKAIIHRELGNYECQITMDYSDAVDALKDYGVTEEQVKAEWPEYFQTCVDNDYF